jgi:hypothetical protein
MVRVGAEEGDETFHGGGEVYVEGKLFPCVWRPILSYDWIDGKSIGSLIIGMSDIERLSREEIADRVEALGY